MLRLTTFGALTLRADDRPVGAAAAQRRPLAVLACIAAGGGAGVTRDRILSLLWPDTDPERARRALTQTLYALRRDTACDALVRGTGHLRFDEAHVHVDTIAVEHLLREGRPADAAALYRGAFLEGFQLAGSEEFERWLELERRRWHRRVSELLQRLAREARARHAIDEELAWCRRLVDHDPVDGAATVALVEALGRAGDPSGARRVVRDHETAVRLELGMPVTQAVASALARVEAGVGTVASPTWRTSATIATLGVPTDATPASPGAVASTRRDAPDHDARLTSDAPGAALAAAAPLATPLVIDASPGPVPAPVPGSAPPVRAAASRARHPGGRTLRRIAGSALAIVVASLLVRVAAPGTLRTVRPVVAVGAVGGVAVTPFSMELADTTLAFLAHDATELMARRLADADDVAVIPMETVHATWRSLDAGAAAPATPRARAMETARRVGASEVVVGRVTGRATRLVITVSALDAVTGRERAGSTMRAPVDSLATIVDALVGHLVAARTLGRDRGEALARTPLDVLRPYLRAEAAYRADRFREAMTLYDASLDRDSTFAPAALGLALAADRLNSAEQHDRALAIAWTSRERLGARDRALLLALAGPRYPAPSPVAEQVAAWERAIELAPDRAEAWTALGERFFADGALLGIRDPHARAATAFGRALAHDTTDARARRRLVEIALRSGDTATARALVDDGQPMRT
ncbi:MAG: hypothetical protein MUF21_10435, partial [Gemmatimonadaceae bacterium]|nr:hypothetical protein [Gemmatimonadaceae bacterium]